MKHFSIFLILMVIVFSCGKTSAQTDSIKKLPSTRWMRTQTFDVKHSAIDLRFNWSKKQAFGTVTITLAPLEATDQIALDAGMLSIESVVLANGQPLNFIYDGGDKPDGLVIALDKTYPKGNNLTLKIKYGTNYVNEADPNNIWGSFGKGLRFFEPTSTTPKKRKQIWSNGEPEANRYWYPCSENLQDLRTSELTATVEKPLMIISNGNLISVKDNPDGTRTFHYKADQPYPNYLTSIVAGEYVDVKQNYGNAVLHTFGYPDEKEAIVATTERLPDMVKFFSEITGKSYPYAHFTQVVVQDYPFPGSNAPHTAAIQSDNMIDDFKTHADFLYLWDGIESQGLASQWFGNLITPRNWNDSWLNQSFCRHLDGLYAGYKNGHDEYLSYYHAFDLATTLGDWNSGYRHPIATKNFDDLNVFTADNYTKIRGNLVLRILRKEVGDAKWKKILQHYVNANAGKQVTTEDLQNSVKATTGDSMQWFFDQWVYKMGQPNFEVSQQYDPVQKQLKLIVTQTQKRDSNNEYPQVDFFQGKIEIEIDNQIETVNLKPIAENVFVFNLYKAPKLVNFDFEKTWIKELQFEKSYEDWRYQLQNSKDILARYTAIDQLVKMVSDGKISTEEKEKTHTAFRSIINSKSYWRLRAYALSQLRMLQPIPDSNTISLLLKTVKDDKPWVRTSANFSLGATNDPKYADLYIAAFSDNSERVVNAAAHALGKSKSPKAFDALVKLIDRPSWKSQSLISALNGLKELGDPRGIAIAVNALRDNRSPRWYLATPIWDYPVAAAQTLVALGKDETVYPMLLERFKNSIKDNDINDIFANTLLLTTIADARGQEVYDLLKVRFAADANAMQAVNQYERQFNEALKNKTN